MKNPRIEISFTGDHNESIRWISDLPYRKNIYQNSNIFIRSPMGTGKTILMKRWIEKEFKDMNICYVSVRKTFTQDTLSKFKDLGFVSYEDIKTQEI